MVTVEAALIAESAGLRFRIDGTGSVLTCRVAGDPTSLLETLRHGRQLLSTMRLLVPVLVRTGLRLDVLAGTVHVAQLGSGVRQNALARLLRLPATHLGA